MCFAHEHGEGLFFFCGKRGGFNIEFLDAVVIIYYVVLILNPFVLVL